uniref:Uncharacterized protein n=1 Tax=viral metagenome TaxID=1070528 RepID=A0A6C0JYY4_9ZZZZ
MTVTFSAGNAGSSKFIALNGKQGGGNKKQGLPSYTGRISGVNYTRSYGSNRFAVFYINQLGGIGKSRSMFSTRAGGVRIAETRGRVRPTGTLPCCCDGPSGCKGCIDGCSWDQGCDYSKACYLSG